ncbi:MAG: CoB--CoM heterodisulfide reductase iron-sulfur subunit A family protein, partial [Thermogutta sp.]|nr:CoB--CoM heterodisulfide reductase iron-sulfur subunit A family protein [Thermogutta sp.]
ISDVVDVDRVVQAAARLPGVVVARQSSAMCSQAGQNLLIEDIQREKLDRIVIGACTPSLHEHTFRAAAARADLNPYLYEHVNLREQVSWCTKSDPEGATDKAIRLIAAGVAKAKKLQPLAPISMKAVRHVAVIGGGISGLRAARDLSRLGFAVTLLERSPFLGGRVAHWHRLYPTEIAARDLLATLIQEVEKDPNITVLTQAEVVEATGCLGNFQLQAAVMPRGVDHLSPEEITAAIEACPVQVASEFDFGLTERKAIYRPYEGCSPAMPAIDWEACTRCGQCLAAVGGKGISLEGEEKRLTIAAGAILLATGFDLYQPYDGELGYGQHREVITLAQLERLLDPQGPTGGRLEWQGRPVRNVCLIHCVGSRQIEGVHRPGPNGKVNTHCSRVCCTATLRAAVEIRRRFPEVNVFDLHQDIRTYGRGHEEYYTEASRLGVVFMRYPGEQPPVVSAAEADSSPLAVRVKDLLTFGEELEVPADLVVLATGMIPRDIESLIEQLKIARSEDGFLQEVHPKLRPVEMAVGGIFLAGTCQAPMDVMESCSGASAAAAKAGSLLSHGTIELEPFRAQVDPDLCQGHGKCVEACRHQQAIRLIEEERDGRTATRAEVNSALCNGCGMCVPVCPTGAIQVAGWRLDQFDAMVDAVVAEHV